MVAIVGTIVLAICPGLSMRWYPWWRCLRFSRCLANEETTIDVLYMRLPSHHGPSRCGDSHSDASAPQRDCAGLASIVRCCLRCRRSRIQIPLDCATLWDSQEVREMPGRC